MIALGAVIYGMGIAGMAGSDSGLALHLSGGLLVGLGVAFTSFSLVLAAIARVVSPERRSLALGFGTAAGSLGQVLFSPVSQAPDIELRLVRLARAGFLHHPGHDPARVHPAGHDQSAR